MPPARWLLTSILIALILLTACTPEPVNVPPTLELDETSSGNSPDTTVTSVQPCSIPPGTPTLDQLSDFAGYPEAIRTFLADGGSINGLESTLRAYALFDDLRGGIWQADLTGNGYFDVIISLLDPAQYSNIPPGGVMLIYGCQNDTYNRLYTLAHEPAAQLSIPLVMHAGDMNRDGRAELIYDVQTCGAHTCFSDIHIINWDAFRGMLQPLQAEMISGALGSYEVYDVGQDGIDDLIIYTGGIGSAGAGPQRQETITLSWDGTAFVEASRVVGPPQYRIHAVYDANKALVEGDLGTAAALYAQVIADDSLLTWEPAPDERSHLNGLAAYGLLLVRAREGGYSSEMAIAAYESLQQIVPPGGPGSQWIRFGVLFWNSLQASQDTHAACQTVIAVITEDPTNPLAMFDYGYANPIPEPAQLCPF